ncbi:MAG: Ig-like domain-containing protein, partial [Lachnospiraceae bacterium]|nr:Ig-like domain-containing protein [Lachnospiraceae bacterium]
MNERMSKRMIRLTGRIVRMVLLPMAMLAALVILRPMAAHAAGMITYVDINGEEQEQLCEIVTDTTVQLDGWYAVTEDVTINERILMKRNANVHLILCDGATITAPMGITVNDNQSLTIYGQKEGTGSLVARTWFQATAAAIGAESSEGCGEITINGGRVTATGGGYGATAIGGNENSQCGRFTMNGGFVKATGGEGGAAIGAGRYGGFDQIMINGGTLQAIGGIDTFDGQKPHFGAFKSQPVIARGIRVYVGNDTTKVQSVDYKSLDDKTFTQNVMNFVDFQEFETRDNPVSIESIFFATEPCKKHDYTWIEDTKKWQCKYCCKEADSLVNLGYIDEAGDPATAEHAMVLPAISAESDETLTLGEAGVETWCAVNQDATIASRITVEGNVHLILCDGATLTVPQGITVEGDTGLTIYGQEKGTGSLVAKTGFMDNRAAIGVCNTAALYSTPYSCGDITINGGRITATGGFYGAAAIGGNEQSRGGSLTINGGFVRATGGESGAAVGAGRYGTFDEIRINGGILQAIGGINTESGQVPYHKAFRSAPEIAEGLRVYAGSDTTGVEEVDYKANGDKTFTQDIMQFVELMDAEDRTGLTDDIFVVVEPCEDHEYIWSEDDHVWRCKYCDAEEYGPIPVAYTDREGNTATAQDVQMIPGSSDEDLILGEAGKETWYAVVGDSVIAHNIFLEGDVNLILCDGKKLSGCALIVGQQDQKTLPSLTIYGQEKQTGKLEAGGCGQDSAAIGSWCYAATGDITILGGRISATADGGNAGIGGGTGSWGGHVTILGGMVTASGYRAVGNGRGGSGCKVTLSDELAVVDGGLNRKKAVIDTPVPYIDAEGQNKLCTAGRPFADYDENELSFGTAGEENWYYVKGNIQIDKLCFLYGDVHLILCDDAKLLINGSLVVNQGNSLTIHAQENGTGALEVHNTSGPVAIGSWSWNQLGTVTILGGQITAISEDGSSAGIGGGTSNGFGDDGMGDDPCIYLYGGTITAQGDDCNAIGNGHGGAGIRVVCGHMCVTDGGLDQYTVALEACQVTDREAYLKDTDTFGFKCAECGWEYEEESAKLSVSRSYAAETGLTLTAALTGELEGVTYQWYLDDGGFGEIEGATDPVYVIEHPENESEARIYRVEATYGGVTAQCEYTVQHIHQFDLVADGAVLRAVCREEEDGYCTLPERTVALTLCAPVYDRYSGYWEWGLNDYYASFDGAEEFCSVTGLSVDPDDILYAGIGFTDYAESNVAPEKAGTYTASFKIADKTIKVDYTIRKALLTVTANDCEITYGDEPDNDGVEFDGFVGGDFEGNLSGELTFTYDYRKYGNVGTYTITPSGFASSDYNFRYVSGKLTVKPKKLGILWDGKPVHEWDIADISVTYNGHAQAPVATLSGVVNGDEVSPVVRYGDEGQSIDPSDLIYPGSTRAGVSGLTGAKAANYSCDTGWTCNYTIEKATLADISVNRTYNASDLPEEGEKIDLNALLPENNRAEYWNLDLSYDTELFIGEPSVSDEGILSFTLNPDSGDPEGDLRIAASNINYYKGGNESEKLYVTVHVKLSKLVLYEQLSRTNRVLRDTRTVATDKSFTLVPGFAEGAVTNTRVVWTSSDPDVAAVTQDGKVTGRSRGTATITINSEEDYEGILASCEVTVVDPATELTLDQKTVNLGIGEHVQINADLLPLTADRRLVWTLDDKKDVIGAGGFVVSPDTMSVVITGNKAGTARFTAATADGSNKKVTCIVNVGNAVPNFGIAGRGDATSVAVGKTLNMIPNWGTNKPKNEGLIWTVATTSGQKTAASVNEKGVLSGLAEGRVVVTATSVANPEKTATRTIDVYVPVASAKLNAATATVSRSADANPFVLTALVTPAVKGMQATGETIGTRPTVSYAVDPAYADVLSVSPNGEVRVIGGTSSIKNIKVTATVKGYGYSRNLDCKVNVVDGYALKNIKLTERTLNLGEGNAATLTAAADPVNADGDLSLVWESSDPSIVTVDNGRVVGIKAGKADVTVRTAAGVPGKNGTVVYPQAVCKVTVKPSVTGVAFTNADDLKNRKLATG